MEVMVVGGGMTAAARRSLVELLLLIDSATLGDEVIVVDPMMEAQELFNKSFTRKLTMLDLRDLPGEVKYEASWNYHHDYNITAPTVAFDRLQQRRKALAKQHFVKPMKKAKKREKSRVKVSWR